MNADIQLQKDLKAKFGATFTKNMSAKDIFDTWMNYVPPQIRDAYPEITTAMMAVQTIMALQDGLKTVTVTASTVYGTAVELLDDATSAIYTGGAVTLAKTALETANQAEVVQDELVNQANASLMGLLGEAIG